MFTVNGKELDYDIFDVEKAKAFQAAINKAVSDVAALERDADRLTWADVIEAQCKAIAECFDAVFGNGEAARIFDGVLNLKLAMQSFQELVEGVNAKKAEIGKMAKAVNAKYGGNRAARRAGK